MLKCEARSPHFNCREALVSLLTALITGSITAHVMRGVNPHYRGFLGDSFIPETLINSLVCYWGKDGISWKKRKKIELDKFDQNLQLRNIKDFNSSANLLSLSFCLKSLWDFIGQELCYFVHNPKRRFAEDNDVHPVNGKHDSFSAATLKTQH